MTDQATNTNTKPPVTLETAYTVERVDALGNVLTAIIVTSVVTLKRR